MAMKIEGYGLECDIWSWGVVLCEMIGGYNPFYSSDIMTMYQNIIKLNIKWPKNLTSGMKDLL